MTSILAFFVLICVLVFVHEYGHFWAARRCGVQVIRFSIGFGKVLWRKTDKQGTEFAFSLIPLGGYVQMYAGEAEYTFSKEQSVESKSVLQRTFIVLAGPVANFLFAILAYWAVFIAGIPTVKPVVGSVLPESIAAQAKVPEEFEIKQVDGREVQDWEEATLALIGKVGAKQVEISGNLVDEHISRSFYLDLSQWQIDGNRQSPLTSLGIRPKSGTVEPIIKQVVEHSAAAKAGVREGDKILSVNQQPFDWNVLIAQVKTGNPLSLVLERSGSQYHVELTPIKSPEEDRYLIGISPHYQPLADKYRTELKYGMLTALEKSVYKVGSLIQTILQFIGNLFTGDLSLKNMGGPISIAKGAGTTVEIGWVYYLGFMALISVNLGVMNLFPILPLDGGKLICFAIEALKGKALPESAQVKFQQFGLMFVLGLMVFTLFNDLLHF
ncbi:MAG: RIP metalloprotease RseP [Pasteurellaceae bacterium]|nr:RIP metalloprotease RseP [Pasteurellaceae bacterium]